ncbi:MAG: glycosyltransferase family 2 protein [bacterium]|nr:glycosyltransferase family 2 protein [bacterium]
MKELTICIPAFNEENAIGDVLKVLKKEYPEAEIIVVNDGSSDRTEEIAKSISGVKVLSHERNRGYGASIKTSAKAASGKVIVWFDADGQHRAEDIRGIAEPVLRGDKDVVIGVRKPGSAVQANRLAGKLILKYIAKLIVRDDVPDLNSGLRCFRLDVIKKYLHLLPDGFSASATSTVLMMKRGYRIGYCDILTQKRKGVSAVKIFRDGFKTIQLLFRILILFESFAFFTVLSLIQLIPAIIYGFYTALTVKKGFPTFASTIIVSGIFTFFMGIICDQITELRKEKFED